MTARSSFEKTRDSSSVATEITAVTRSCTSSGTNAALFAPTRLASRLLMSAELFVS